MRAVFAAMRRMWSSRPLRLRVVPNFGERCCRPEGLLFQGRHNEGVERGEQGVGWLVVIVVCAAVGAGAGPACVLVDASRDDHGRHTRMSAAMRMSTAATTAGINHDGECGVTFGFADCVMADGAAGRDVGAGRVAAVGDTPADRVSGSPASARAKSVQRAYRSAGFLSSAFIRAGSSFAKSARVSASAGGAELR